MLDYISKNKVINAIKSLESTIPPKDNYAKGYDAALSYILIAVREIPLALTESEMKFLYDIEKAKENINKIKNESEHDNYEKKKV